MTATVADQVFARVTALTRGDPGMTRAAAIRAVATEMGRSVPATSSAFYSGAKRAEPPAAPAAPAAPAPARVPARTRRSAKPGHPDPPALYAEMLPLVEAGATVEQAARRFGDEESVAEIAAGFSLWREREQPAPAAPPAEPPSGDALARLASVEAENRILRRELTRAHQALRRVRAIVETVPDP